MTPFLLLTPAHNEVDHLDLLFRSILDQERRPDLWVFCDDGSTDGTGERAEQLAADHDFIVVLRRTRQGGRQLNAKADSVRAAYEAGIAQLPEATFVASIDGDVSLPANTFSFLADRFADDPDLGVAGGIYLHDVDGEVRPGRTRPSHVPGPLQMFRREVFDAIDGYRSLPDGGLDVVSAAHARMLGWRTEAFPELTFDHNRRMGTGGGRRPLTAEFHGGIRDRSLGLDLPFIVAKCVRRLTDPPIVLASGARLIGYLYSVVTRRPSGVPDDVAAFIRTEQRQRLLPGWLRVR